jgi:hypothetical protein
MLPVPDGVDLFCYETLCDPTEVAFDAMYNWLAANRAGLFQTMEEWATTDGCRAFHCALTSSQPDAAASLSGAPDTSEWDLREEVYEAWSKFNALPGKTPADLFLVVSCGHALLFESTVP